MIGSQNGEDGSRKVEGPELMSELKAEIDFGSGKNRILQLVSTPVNNFFQALANNFSRASDLTNHFYGFQLQLP